VKEILNYWYTYSFKIINTEALVPSKYWGLKESTTLGDSKYELDFMHFKGVGHRFLADTIALALKQQ
jgi:hypothetical protein